MNQYEREKVKRIINEIKEMEKEQEMSDTKKAYYLYRCLGEIYQYKVNYIYANETSYEERKAKIDIYYEGTNEEGEAICIDMNRTYMEALEMLGIDAHLSFMDEGVPLSHADICFKDKEGKWYFANLTSDIMHIKTGMKIRNFGLSEEQLKNKLYNEKPEKNRLYHLLRMHEENEGEQFTGISEAKLKQWDDESGYTYQGFYTNDILDMLAQEMLDEDFISEFFGTKKKDELVQKKIEFVMDRLEIVNVHRKKKIGDAEAIEYYQKISKKILTKEEIKKYMDICYGFVEDKGLKKARILLLIKKDNENVYYLYNSERQVFVQIDKEEILKEPIKYYSVKENKDKDISEAINHFEERLEEKEIE